MRKVLIVDDERLIADTLVIIFQNAGYQARAAYSAEEAAEIFASWFPDFALIDVILPGMNGINFAILLKEQFPDCKVSLFSGQAETNDLLKEANAQGHSLQILAKPVAPAELLSIAAKELQLPLPPAPPPHTD
jgi:CheY-like chemotaxis protein